MKPQTNRCMSVHAGGRALAVPAPRAQDDAGTRQASTAIGGKTSRGSSSWTHARSVFAVGDDHGDRAAGRGTGGGES